MKLLDILVNDLPKVGGWPRGISALVQSSKGAIYKAGGGFPVLISHLAEDWELAEVTHLQYEAAILEAPPKIAWNGEGLPPVGCECEALFDTERGEWYRAKVIGHDGNCVVGRWLDGPKMYEILDYSSPAGSFRAIHSEADKKRREAIDELIHLIGISPESAATCYDVCLRMASK